MTDLGQATNADDVARIFGSRHYRKLTLERPTREQWLVATPYEFGARNWFLYLDFDGEILVRLRVRTEDSAEFGPADAPVDIIRIAK